MLKIWRSRDRPIFNMGIPIPGKDGPYIETGPWPFTKVFLRLHVHTRVYVFYKIKYDNIICNWQVSIYEVEHPLEFNFRLQNYITIGTFKLGSLCVSKSTICCNVLPSFRHRMHIFCIWYILVWVLMFVYIDILYVCLHKYPMLTQK